MNRMILFLAWLALALAAGAREHTARRVLFIGGPGNANGPVAALMLERIASHERLAVEAVARSLQPGRAMPSSSDDGPQRDGVGRAGFASRALTQSDIDAAHFVVLIDTDLPNALRTRDKPFWRWNGVPPATGDDAAARTALRGRIEELLDALDVR